MIISTEQLISATKARNEFGKLLNKISQKKGDYFVILENGKIAALLVHPDWIKQKHQNEFPNLEELRNDWNRHTDDIVEAFKKIQKTPKHKLPKLLQ